MAIGTSFKQQCPSCEAMVPVKDASLVGKKIECPKCKDKFIVKSPAKTEAKEVEEKPAAPTKANGKAAPAKIPAKPGPDKKEAVVDEAKANKGGAKANKTKPVDEDAEDEDADEDKKTKKKSGLGKFSIVHALAVVGLLVLGTAAYFMMQGKGTQSTNKSIAKGPSKGGVPAPTQTEKPTSKKNKEPAKEKETDTKPSPVQAVALSAANAELTNLLPNESQHVAHVPLGNFFDPASTFRDALFQTPDGLKDDFLRGKLGFSLLTIDDLLRAERYGADGWTFAVIHFQEIIDQDAVKKALDLKPAPIVKSHTHFQVSTPNPWLDQLARITIGVPRQLSSSTKQDNRATYVHFHNPQTLIVADLAPMVAFLQQDKQFKTMSTKTELADTKEVPPPTDAPTDAAGEKSKSNTTPRVETYITIKPALKDILDRMEATGSDGKEKILFSSATDLEAARLPGANPNDKEKVHWSPREVWDLAFWLQNRNPRLRALGVGLSQKDSLIFQYRNEIQCPVDNDARELQKELAEEKSPEIALFIDRLLAHKVMVPKKEEASDPSNPKTPQRPFIRPNPNVPKSVVKKEEAARSSITVVQNDKTVNFVLDLRLEQPEVSKLHSIAALMGIGLRASMDVAAGLFTRHDLARAGKLLPEKGLSERGVLPGNYPPGAFLRPSSNNKRYFREPLNRVSWMAGLLPFLGQDTLYSKINFNDSWRDPSNWAAAGTLVAQFLDPTYPPSSHFVSRPDLPFEPASTHFVGIAGIGLDAADYDPSDPALIPKRGVMSYDKGMSLEEVRKGHGLANTILMIQVPPESMTGFGPWMAGGGGTLRGVPDKNSIAPFVFSSTTKEGKSRRGTYALMADGSVRFIDQNVPDEVFKAMATAALPMPGDFVPDASDSKTPLEKAPKGFSLASPVVPAKK